MTLSITTQDDSDTFNGIPIIRSRPWLRRNLSLDLFALGKGVEAVLYQLAKGKIFSAIDEARKIQLAGAPSRAAWDLIRKALETSIIELLRVTGSQFKPWSNLKSLDSTLKNEFSKNKIVIDIDLFDDPRNSPIISFCQKPLYEWLVAAGLKDTEANAVCDRLPEYFANSLVKTWGRRPSKYKVLETHLKEKIAAPFFQYKKQELKWLLYQKTIKRKIFEPIFDEVFCLNQVYIKLRACRLHKQAGNQQVKRGFEVTDAEAEIVTWLEDRTSDYPICVISGEPGLGKSMLARKVAATFAGQPRRRVILIELYKNFHLKDSLEESVNHYLDDQSLVSESSLKIRTSKELTVLIFDGLDEFVSGESDQFTQVRSFMTCIFKTLSSLESDNLRIIITSRKLTVQYYLGPYESFCLTLNLLPFLVSVEESSDLEDPHSLLESDQRREWWDKYSKLVDAFEEASETEKFLSLLSEPRFRALTSNPLLLYLLATHFKNTNRVDNESRVDNIKNFNAVYRGVISTAMNRRWSRYQTPSARSGIDENQFINVIEDIAVVSWQSGSRYATFEALSKYSLRLDSPRILGFVEQEEEAGIIGLLSAFYFQQHTNSDKTTFEFTHKTFCEYFTARRIVRAVREASSLVEKNYLRRALKWWAVICGPNWIDSYLLEFLRDEFLLQAREDCIKWKKVLSQMFEYVIKAGLPMEEFVSELSFKQQTEWARNAEEALLVCLNACAEVSQEAISIDWGSSIKTFGEWLAAIQGQRTGFHNRVVLDSLSWLDISGQALPLRDLWSSNLRHAILNQTHLESSNLGMANLEAVSMNAAKLDYATLIRANFRDSIMEGADFAWANMFRANLERAQLRDAKFQDATLTGVNLGSADLRNADFRRANLTSADLRKANLEGADLRSAILNRANIEGATLAAIRFDGTKAEGLIGSPEAAPDGFWRMLRDDGEGGQTSTRPIRVESLGESPSFSAVVASHANQETVELEITRALVNSTSILHVDLERSEVSDQHISQLSNLPNLKSINLIDCVQITDKSLESLSRISSLEQVDLAGNEIISDEGVAHLGRLRNLVRLRIAFCRRFSDHGLRKLAKLTNIKYLDLEGCEGISRSGAKYILSECKSIREINLNLCDIPESAIDTLVREHPHVDVRVWFSSNYDRHTD